jgi:hypothetical protein
MNPSRLVLLSGTAATVFFASHLAAGTGTEEEQARYEAQRAALEMCRPMSLALREKGRDAFPELARFLTADSRENLFCLELGMRYICFLDGRDAFSEGSPEMLSATRGILVELLDRDKTCETATELLGLVYLAQKGNAEDLPLMDRYLAAPPVQIGGSLISVAAGTPRRILEARAVGTNVLGGIFSSEEYPYFGLGQRDSYSTNDLRFLPSVANTGPQAAYVYKTYWKVIERFSGGISSQNTPYSAITNAAPELLTMRVWFDADGKAVTDADLAKYGIEVPGLGFAPAAPAPQGPPPASAPVDADAPPAAKASGSPPQSRFVAPLAAGAGLLAALLLWRGLRRRKP